MRTCAPLVLLGLCPKLKYPPLCGGIFIDIHLTTFLPLFRTDLTHFLLVFGTVFARFSLFAVAHAGEHGVGIDINVLRRDYGKVQVRRVAVSGVTNVAYKLALLHAVAFAEEGGKLHHMAI